MLHFRDKGRYLKTMGNWALHGQAIEWYH